MPAPRRVLVISITAQEDFRGILKQSVLSWGREQAATYRDLLNESMERLLDFPDIGRSVPELFDGGHRLRVRHHMIYYTFSDDDVIIHRILHERRHVTSSLMEPLEPEEQSGSE